MHLTTLTLACFLGITAANLPHDFVSPKNPLSPSLAKAPSAKVTNGTAFESGAISLEKGQTLRLPANAAVEEYDGATALFYLTKSLACLGQPPVSMRYHESRQHFGIAQRVEGEIVDISTFGEWSNRGGAASIRLLVLIPRGQKYTQIEGLHGAASKASSKFRPGDEALRDCYWYAGPRPKLGWTAIATHLNHNRFLKPR